MDHALVEQADFADQPVMLTALAGEQARFELPRPVDDPRQAADGDVEERADAVQQEDRRHDLTDDLG